MIGIIDPVMTPMSELKPYFIQPTNVVGRSLSSSSGASSPEPWGSCLTTAL
jgi:hypothetical protein